MSWRQVGPSQEYFEASPPVLEASDKIHLAHVYTNMNLAATRSVHPLDMGKQVDV